MASENECTKSTVSHQQEFNFSMIDSHQENYLTDDKKPIYDFWQTFSVKSQTVNIFCFVAHTQSLSQVFNSATVIQKPL